MCSVNEFVTLVKTWEISSQSAEFGQIAKFSWRFYHQGSYWESYSLSYDSQLEWHCCSGFQLQQTLFLVASKCPFFFSRMHLFMYLFIHLFIY